MTNGRARRPPTIPTTTRAWTVHDASELYEVARWGNGYFSVNGAGHVQVHPTKDPAKAIDLKELVDRLQLRGISLPVLVRFTDILKHRLGDMHAAFQTAIAQHQYQGGYSCVYPIKVNQQRQVVEEVFKFGRPYKFGLEAGSKPELLAVVAVADNETPIICNGFKDAEFIETAMLAQKMGRNIIPVVEKYTELALILDAGGKDRRPAADRHAGQAGVARQRPVAVLGRVPVEVRPDRHRNHARARGAQVQGHGRLLQAPALPPRQPDHQHPHRQRRAERGRARLHGAGQAGRRPAVPRRRRRPGRGLRRLADELRIEHELHARGVRQRRRLSHPERVRRGRRTRTRRSSRRAAAPRSPTTACSSSTCSACRGSATRRCRPQPTRTGNSRSSTWSRRTTTSTPATRSRRSTTRSRRSTWR